MRSMIQFGLLASSVIALYSCEDSGASVNNSSSSTAGSSSSRSVDVPMTVDCGVPTSCTPDAGAQIEVTCPKGGETLVPGDTLVIRWRTLVADFTGYVPQYSANGGSSYTALVTGSVLAETGAGDAQCLSYKTVVPSDGSVTGSVIYRVKDYSSSLAAMRDAADPVTVLAP